MKSILFGTTADDPGAGPTYAFPTSHGFQTWGADESLRVIPFSDEVSISGLTVTVDTAPGAGKWRDYTIRKNGEDTLATVRISGTDLTATYTGGPIKFSRFDYIDIQQVGTGAPAAPGNTYWWMWANTVGNKSFIMGACETDVSGTVTNFGNPFGAGAMTTVANNQDVPVATNGTLTFVVTHCHNPPFSESYDVSMRVNNTTDALTATTTVGELDTPQSGSQALVAGDAIQIKVVPSGSPTPTVFSWCYTFEPTINGESIFGYGSATTLSTTNTQFNQPLALGTGWNTSEAGRFLRLPACSLKKLRVRLHAAPGGVGKSRATTVRVEAADTALAVTHTNTDTFKSDTTNTVAVTANQRVSVRTVPTLTPAASQCHIGLCILTPQPAPKSSAYSY